MIKLGKLTDYAVHIMASLANDNDRTTKSASYLSSKTGIPEPTVAKILKKLSQGGIVKSVRGAAGGYKVSENIVNISLLDLVTLLEGPVSIVTCADGVSGSKEECFGYETCVVKGKWVDINRSIVALLKGIKLLEMIEVDAATAAASCCGGNFANTSGFVRVAAAEIN